MRIAAQGKFPVFLSGQRLSAARSARLHPFQPDIITPVGVGKVAIRTAAPRVDSLRVKVVRSGAWGASFE